MNELHLEDTRTGWGDTFLGLRRGITVAAATVRTAVVDKMTTVCDPSNSRHLDITAGYCCSPPGQSYMGCAYEPHLCCDMTLNARFLYHAKNMVDNRRADLAVLPTPTKERQWNDQPAPTA